jgi:hypothetical protein
MSRTEDRAAGSIRTDTAGMAAQRALRAGVPSAARRRGQREGDTPSGAHAEQRERIISCADLEHALLRARRSFAARLHGALRRALRAVPSALLAWVVAVGASATALAATPEPAGAIATQTFTFEPVSPPNATVPRTDFSYVLHPGARLVDEVALSNLSDTPQRFLLYASDGYDLKNGGYFVLEPRTVRPTGVGAWVHLVTNAYTVPPRMTATIPFSLDVPPNAPPGDHAGGIVALDVTPQPTKQGKVTVNIRRGIGIALYVRVIGPLHPGIVITTVGATTSQPALDFAQGTSSAVVYFTVKNVGNVDLRGVATAKVTDLFGRVVKVFPPAKFSVIVPGAVFTVLEPRWKPLPIAGPEHVTVTLTTNAAGTVVAGSTFWIVPWVLVVAIVILLALVVAWRIRRRRTRPPAAPSLPQPTTVRIEREQPVRR